MLIAFQILLFIVMFFTLIISTGATEKDKQLNATFTAISSIVALVVTFTWL
ncbi:hypothetical protein [Virgibacillus sp. CBA3643]|uniref:hypothetical protein n=1 Tax=Virgibacillus sp. CBA3643 TaxID=2942278 RepID=UPI0035A363C3